MRIAGETAADKVGDTVGRYRGDAVRRRRRGTMGRRGDDPMVLVSDDDATTTRRRQRDAGSRCRTGALPVHDPNSRVRG